MEHGIRIRAVIMLWLFMSGIGVSHAQDYSTCGEIYDYEIGDIFHFHEWGNTGNSGYGRTENIEVLDKIFSTDSSSITYYQFVKRESHYSGYPPQIVYEEFYENVSYDNLDSIFIADSIYSNTNYNYRKQSYYDISLPPNYTQYRHYVDGCGLAYQYWYECDPPYTATWEQELLYFKKGDEEWGTPQIIIGTKELKGTIYSINTYPNPFTTSTTIEYELKEISNIQFTVYNVMGEVVYVIENRMMPQGSHKVIWSSSHLAAGLYYAVLRSEKGVSVVKMLKE